MYGRSEKPLVGLLGVIDRSLARSLLGFEFAYPTLRTSRRSLYGYGVPTVHETRKSTSHHMAKKAAAFIASYPAIDPSHLEDNRVKGSINCFLRPSHIGSAKHDGNQPDEMYTFAISRPRIGNDGYPAVTFPRNFDHVVGLMNRRDLMGPQGGDSEGVSLTLESTGDGSPAIRRAAKASSQERLPWTKYLLDEGLDCTEVFSKYKGVLAGAHGRDTKR